MIEEVWNPREIAVSIRGFLLLRFFLWRDAEMAHEIRQRLASCQHDKNRTYCPHLCRVEMTGVEIQGHRQRYTDYDYAQQ